MLESLGFITILLPDNKREFSTLHTERREKERDWWVGVCKDEASFMPKGISRARAPKRSRMNRNAAKYWRYKKTQPLCVFEGFTLEEFILLHLAKFFWKENRKLYIRTFSLFILITTLLPLPFIGYWFDDARFFTYLYYSVQAITHFIFN